MGTTVQDTYKPIDEWQDRKDKRLDNKKLAIENRHKRRMSRINNRNCNSRSYYSPYYYPNFYSNNYVVNGYMYNHSLGYGQRRDYYGASSYYRQGNRCPVGVRIGVPARLGNFWVGF